jgi:fatty-acyl-CoA synthase
VNVNTVASLLRARADDDKVGLRFEHGSWTWAEVVQASADRAALLRSRRDPSDSSPFHVGVLLENVPEYLFWAGAAALAGASIVGINPTRRGAELARDIRHTDCAFLVTDTTQAGPLDGIDHGVAPANTWLIDSDAYAADLAPHVGSALPAEDPRVDTILFLLFTSGSTSAPKAVVCSTARMAETGVRAGEIYGVTRDEVCYCPMPLFHGNALMACWAPALAVGAEVVLRRKFTASGFLDDIRAYGCTYFTYVGRTIAYVLGQPPTDHDKDHRLRMGFGTEASAIDRQRFMDRFDCPLVEGYGSSESVVAIIRTPDTPPNALGLPRPDMAGFIEVVDPETCEICPPAVFDEHGAITNPESIGELVNTSGGGSFEGYYNNTDATDERLRNGWYWTGDLGYRDEAGFFYFGGRSADWLRVDSENFAAAPVEGILQRHPGIVMAAVYPVPDPRTGDMVMAAVEMRSDATFDPTEFETFLTEQRDLGTKWSPRLIRIVTSMPLTANNKVHKPPLRAQRWDTTDAIWWRRERDQPLTPMTDADREALLAEFDANGRRHVLSTT